MENGEEKEENEPVFLDRSSRATRGKRMTKLVDDEIEEDDVFWNQEALKEEEVDNEYEAEPEAADIFDSDFDEDEPEPDTEVVNEPKERSSKKRLLPPGKPSSKKKKKIITILDESPENEKSFEHHRTTDNNTPDDAEKVVRKSTRTAVIVKQAERDAINAVLQATMKPIKRKKEGEERRMTQEEMLLEAAQTEIMNLRSLERVLAKEEETKKKAIVHKAVYLGPQTRYFSRNGCSYLEYMNGASFESKISTESTPYPEKSVCVVTGLPAKYLDPKTGQPYATKEAFKIIRERFDEESKKGRKSMNKGEMEDTISGQGFSEKRKRSVIRNDKNVSYYRENARFRTIPALDDQESD